MSERPAVQVTIHRIHDVPGYQWELGWSEADGEYWNEEHTTESLLQTLADILVALPPDASRHFARRWSASDCRGGL